MSELDALNTQKELLLQELRTKLKVLSDLSYYAVSCIIRDYNPGKFLDDWVNTLDYTDEETDLLMDMVNDFKKTLEKK